MNNQINISELENYFSELFISQTIVLVGRSSLAGCLNSVYINAYIKPESGSKIFVAGQEREVPPASSGIVIWEVGHTAEGNWSSTLMALRGILRSGGLLILIQSESESDKLINESKDAAVLQFTRITNYLHDNLHLDNLLTSELTIQNLSILYVGRTRGEVWPRPLQARMSEGDVASRQINQLQMRIDWLASQLVDRGGELMQIRASTSWMITRPLRLAMDKLLRLGPAAIRVRNALRYAVLENFGALQGRPKLSLWWRDLLEPAGVGIGNPGATKFLKRPTRPARWGVLVTTHTMFVGNLIIDKLRSHGWAAELLTDSPPAFHHDMYIVLCPQMFKRLPPREKRISYQMEQSISSRWFTQEYLFILHDSLCVLDYSLNNIEFLTFNGIQYPKVYYLPIGATDKLNSQPRSTIEKTIDVLFYGDVQSSPRRQKILRTLQHYFNVQIVDNKFGPEMSNIIRSAKLVINIHYYENALLEMPRIQECLSLGVPVVSESSQDQDNYPECAGAVTFFDSDEPLQMVEVVRRALEQSDSTIRINQAVTLGQRRFDFMFDRFLVSMGFLSNADLVDSDLLLSKDIARVTLSMPETVRRRKTFQANRPAGCEIFDGLRMSPGWIGCGLSYKALARFGLKNQLQRLTIMEDDVELPADFESKWSIVNEYLDSIEGEWDCFAGLIASVNPQTKILHQTIFKGLKFITINKMTSTVCNIYSRTGLNLMSSWNSENHDDVTNTIDKYLESHAKLRVIVVIPFIVGHREDERSTLWGFSNREYKNLIVKSENTLRSMS